MSGLGRRYSPRPRRHEIHEPRVEDHEDDVEDVEGEEEGGLVVHEVAVPGEADERDDGHCVEEGVSRQRPPVQVQNLQPSEIQSQLKPVNSSWRRQEVQDANEPCRLTRLSKQ